MKTRRTDEVVVDFCGAVTGQVVGPDDLPLLVGKLFHKLDDCIELEVAESGGERN